MKAPRGYRFKQVYQRTDTWPNVTTTGNSATLNIWTNIGGWVTVKEPVLWKRWELWMLACPLWGKR